MFSLFPLEPITPPGFSYQENFITAIEEETLIEAIQAQHLAPMQFHQYEAKRLVAGFGKGWSFTEQKINEGRPIPELFLALRSKVAFAVGLLPDELAQLLLTYYPIGAVINWHRDAPPHEVVCGVSLMSDVNFKLRPQDKVQQVRSNTISLSVKRRSMYCMRDAAKSSWQHCTSPGKTERYSITFRKLRN